MEMYTISHRMSTWSHHSLTITRMCLFLTVILDSTTVKPCHDIVSFREVQRNRGCIGKREAGLQYRFLTESMTQLWFRAVVPRIVPGTFGASGFEVLCCWWCYLPSTLTVWFQIEVGWSFLGKAVKVVTGMWSELLSTFHLWDWAALRRNYWIVS